MKAFKMFAMVAIAAIALTSCNNVEKILPKKDGRWDVTRVEAKTYFDGQLANDTVITEDLGFVFYAEDGTGYSEDEAGVKVDGSEFTWTTDDETLTITDTSGTYTSTILEVSNKELLLELNQEEDTGIFGVIRIETKSTLVRAD